MKKYNVLVFPCGSEIGLEVYRSLHGSIHFSLIGGSSVDDHGKFVYESYIGGLPQIDDVDFIDVINKTVDEHDIEFIIPAHDSVILKLAQASAKGQLHGRVITSPVETCEIARSKKKTYDCLKDIVLTPTMFSKVEVLTESDFPIFMKPDIGQGSKGTHRADSLRDVEFYLEKDESLMLLEYLPGKEYTVDCFTDRTGELRFCEGRERARVSNGISVASATVEDEEFSRLAQVINKQLVFRGAWFFQLKLNRNCILTLLEIAPRIAGTSGLVRARGVNLTLLSLFDALGYDVDIFENDCTIAIDRALENKYIHDVRYDHVYLDFDDLVILDGKVNTAIMAFIYQCRNKGVTVHLVTRHGGDLPSALKDYRLDNVFDEVVWIKDGALKTKYIRERNAIFIDDSFAERKAVHDILGLPVYDTHMVEGLVEG